MRFQAPESLSEQIAQHLGKQIILGYLQPRERIQEMKIASELDVSRGSVREALLILQGRHLVSIYPRKGAVVSDLTPHHVNCLYDVYETILTMLVQKLAAQWTDESIRPLLAHLKDLQARAQGGELDGEGMTENGFKAMAMAAELVGNPYLEEMLQSFWPAISRTYYLAMSRSAKTAVEGSMVFYTKVVDAVLKRDQAAVADAVKEFGGGQREQVLNYLRQQAA